jgi:hypothetical protein
MARAVLVAAPAQASGAPTRPPGTSDPDRTATIVSIIVITERLSPIRLVTEHERQHQATSE